MAAAIASLAYCIKISTIVVKCVYTSKAICNTYSNKATVLITLRSW